MRNNNKKRKKRQEICKEGEIRRVSLPGGEILVDVRKELLETAIFCGLEVMEAMFSEDVEAFCGPRYYRSHDGDNFRWGRTSGEVTLGGGKIGISRPRVRSEGKGELALPIYEHLKREDPLRKRVLEQLLLGVSSRRYKHSLETRVEGIVSRGTSKSAVSRRFVAMTMERLTGWMSRPLGDLEAAIIFIDGKEFGDHTIITTIGIDKEGVKHVLGAWEGATENTQVAQALIDNLAERGLKVDEEKTLFIIDGSKALHKAIRDTFGQEVSIQRCQRHKRENVKSHLPKHLHSSVELAMRQAYQSGKVDTAKRIITNLAARLEIDWPGAAGSLREGLDETLTVVELGLPKTLRQSLQTTNVIESALSIVEDISRNVKRWRNGAMALRWTATGLIEAEKRFRKIRGYREIPLLIHALKKAREAKEVISKRKEVA